uniref:Uncharacterized protein n=1 Tax=viral metagenome TaxID=1070528 RepID=A0A6H1ZMF9_9ZZZZ
MTTKTQLEHLSKLQTNELSERRLEIGRLQREVDMYKSILSRHDYATSTMTIALEKVTECVAHVVSDMRAYKERSQR